MIVIDFQLQWFVQYIDNNSCTQFERIAIEHTKNTVYAIDGDNTAYRRDLNKSQ